MGDLINMDHVARLQFVISNEDLGTVMEMYRAWSVAGEDLGTVDRGRMVTALALKGKLFGGAGGG